jgi:hypothetical protein
MVYIYKNFLLVNRIDPIQNAIDMTKRMNIWFKEENELWHAKSAHDKVILIFQEIISLDDNIKEYKEESTIDFSLHTCIGFMHVYCQGTHMKVGNYMFKPNINYEEQYWRLLKKYLVKTIQQTNVRPSEQQFTLHWNKLISPQAQITIRNAGLLSDNTNMLYVFKDEDMFLV